MTSTENFDLLENEAIPVTTRVAEWLSHSEANKKTLLLYLAGAQNGDVRDTELVELMGVTLRSAAIGLRLADQFLSTLDANDPSYQVRIDGFNTMKRGLANIVNGSLQTISERQSYRGQELLRLVDYMQETCPFIVPRLLPSSRAEVLVRMEMARDDPANVALKPALSDLHDKVQVAVNGGISPHESRQ